MKTRPIDPIVAAHAAGRFTDVQTKLLASAGDGTPQMPRGPPPRRAYSIAEFCVAVGISQAFYFELKREGRGPREMKLGNRRLISVEEAIRWCAEQTAASNSEDPKEAA